MNNEPDYDNLYFERKKMTQKIFDTDNAEDMALLWSILPDDINVIRKHHGCQTLYGEEVGVRYNFTFINIDWHDKSKITRPIQEATEKDFGKICKGWNGEDDAIILLKGIDADGYFVDDHSWCWKHCRRLTKKEIEELI